MNYYFREKGKAFSIEKIFEELAESLNSSSIKVKRLYCPFSGGKNLLSVFRNGLWARRNAKDINHVTGDAHYLALFLRKKSCVLTIHDCDMLRPLSGLKRWFVWLIWLYLPVHAAGAVTVISEKTKEELCRLTKIKPSSVRVIPNCVSESFQSAPKTDFPKKARVLILGTKGHKNIFRIFKALTELNVEIRVIGELTKEQEGHLYTFELQWTNACRLSNEDILSEYKRCDLVLFPSLHEGFGMPIVEAQAIGRPVITSNLSPMKEVSGMGALLVDPESVESIRAGVYRILNEPYLRKDLIEKGRENVKRFRLSVISARYQEIYDQLKRV
jgi:glycosyltransferase involved in cell wall biosynthesis